MISKTNFKIDLPSLQIETHNLMTNQLQEWKAHGQLCLTHRPGKKSFTDGISSLWDSETNSFWANETEFTEFNTDLKDTYFEWLYKNLPYKIGRMRLMGREKHSTYSIHKDREKRIHLAIFTNPDSYILFRLGSSLVGFHIPADGHVYEMDAKTPHTAINCGDSMRVHLVISERE